jgi:uncharacterized membrane-anchored protein YitT (DUF2179 family)
MKTETKLPGGSVSRLLAKYAKVVFGSVVYAIGFQLFMFPNRSLAQNERESG